MSGIGWQLPAAILAGGACGLGLVLFVLALRGHDLTASSTQPRRQLRSLLRPRFLAAVGVGLAVLLVTRWVAVAAAVAAVVAAWPVLFGAAAETKATITRLEAVAAWVESMRDVIVRGQALPEAIRSTATRVQPVLARPMQDLLARMDAREPLDRALLLLADDIADPIADRAMHALALNATVQGRRLAAVLATLASATRRQVEVRREVDAKRRSIRRSARIVMVVVAALVVGMAVLRREFVEPYSTVTGQLVLVVVVACFLGGFAWLRRLSRFQAPARFLATPAVLAQLTATHAKHIVRPRVAAQSRVAR